MGGDTQIHGFCSQLLLPSVYKAVHGTAVICENNMKRRMLYRKQFTGETLFFLRPLRLTDCNM